MGAFMNLFDLPNMPLTEEEVTILAQDKNIRIERIISTGQVSDWYDQEETEFVCLVEGFAVIEFEDKTLEMKKGDTIIINPHERHKINFTSSEPPCIWLCVFYN